MLELSLVQKIAIWVVPVVLGITVHEVAHGWIASRLGDKTAMMMGRLTLNPMKHIDPMGTILIPALLLLMNAGFIFGYAKPVPITWQNLGQPKRDMALVAVAGPLSNLLMAGGWALLIRLALLLGENGTALVYMGVAGITINTFMLDDAPELLGFVEHMTPGNRGRAFYTEPGVVVYVETWVDQ